MNKEYLAINLLLALTPAMYSQVEMLEQQEYPTAIAISTSDHYMASSPLNEAKNRVSEIMNAYGDILKVGVSGNAFRFIMALSDIGVIPEKENISATDYGNIIIDVENERGLISMEIGSKQLGFFTDFPRGENYGSDGITTDFKSVPDQLLHLF